MIHELQPPETLRVSALFAPMAFHASCAAVLDGTNPGRVLVDDLQHPAAAFVLSPEAAYLAGDADAAAFGQALRTRACDPEFLGMALWHLVWIVSSPSWVEWLRVLAGQDRLRTLARRHYVCDVGARLQPVATPAGAVLRNIDAALLDGDVAVPEHVQGWIRNNWGSRQHYLAAGFGVAVLHGREVVAWSVADCVTGRTCEVGIHTADEWRRQGYGAFAARGAIQRTLELGMETVGWHCHEENVASWRTAERAGFRLERTYQEYAVGEPAGNGAG